MFFYVGVMVLLSFGFAAYPSNAIQAETTQNLRHEKRRGKSIPMVDTSIADVPLDQIFFDTFNGGSTPLSEASESLILKLRDVIPPLTSPEYDIAKEVDWLNPDDLIIAYLDGNQAYAYPIKILNYHEIVHEEVNVLPILISYCPLCRSGIVYSRVLEGKILTFGNTSALFESDMVMYDHQTGSYWHQVGGKGIVSQRKGPTGAAYLPQIGDRSLSMALKRGRIIDQETGSTWSLSGQAINGPLKGKTLRPIPSRYAFWFAMVSSYPEIEVFKK